MVEVNALAAYSTQHQDHTFYRNRCTVESDVFMPWVSRSACAPDEPNNAFIQCCIEALTFQVLSSGMGANALRFDDSAISHLNSFLHPSLQEKYCTHFPTFEDRGTVLHSSMHPICSAQLIHNISWIHQSLLVVLLRYSMLWNCPLTW